MVQGERISGAGMVSCLVSIHSTFSVQRLKIGILESHLTFRFAQAQDGRCFLHGDRTECTNVHGHHQVHALKLRTQSRKTCDPSHPTSTASCKSLVQLRAGCAFTLLTWCRRLARAASVDIGGCMMAVPKACIVASCLDDNLDLSESTE